MEKSLNSGAAIGKNYHKPPLNSIIHASYHTEAAV